MFHSKKSDVEPHRKTHKNSKRGAACCPADSTAPWASAQPPRLPKKPCRLACSSFSLITPKPGKDTFLSDRMQTLKTISVRRDRDRCAKTINHRRYYVENTDNYAYQSPPLGPVASSDLGDLYAESGQTLQGSFSAAAAVDRIIFKNFSAVSKPNFANKYALESSRRDLHNALLCTVL